MTEQRYRVDYYLSSEFEQGFTEAHFFPTIEKAVQNWLEVGWGYEHLATVDESEPWDATTALLSEVAFVVDQEAEQVARIAAYEPSETSRLPVAVVRDGRGNELARVAVENTAVA